MRTHSVRSLQEPALDAARRASGGVGGVSAVGSQADPWSVAQCVGYLATLVNISAFAIKRDATFKRTLATGLSLWAVHYALLGAWTAAGTALVIASRQALSIVATRMSTQLRIALSGAYLAVFTVILAATWVGPVSLWPWLAAVNATYAFMWLSGVRMRAQVLVSTGFWLINALLVGSIGHCITSTITLVITVFTIARMQRDAEGTAPVAAGAAPEYAAAQGFQRAISEPLSPSFSPLKD